MCRLAFVLFIWINIIVVGAACDKTLLNTNKGGDVIGSFATPEGFGGSLPLTW